MIILGWWQLSLEQVFDICTTVDEVDEDVARAVQSDLNAAFERFSEDQCARFFAERTTHSERLARLKDYRRQLASVLRFGISLDALVLAEDESHFAVIEAVAAYLPHVDAIIAKKTASATRRAGARHRRRADAASPPYFCAVVRAYSRIGLRPGLSRQDGKPSGPLLRFTRRLIDELNRNSEGAGRDGFAPGVRSLLDLSDEAIAHRLRRAYPEHSQINRKILADLAM